MGESKEEEGSKQVGEITTTTTMANPNTQENLHGTQMAVTHTQSEPGIKGEPEESVIKGVGEIKEDGESEQAKEDGESEKAKEDGESEQAKEDGESEQAKEDGESEQAKARGKEPKEQRTEKEKLAQEALAKFISVEARLDDAKGRLEAGRKEVNKLEEESDAAINKVASLTEYTVGQITSFERELLLGAINYHPIRDFVYASFTSILNFITTSWNSLLNFIPVLANGIWNLLCDYANDKTSRKLALMWKFFISLAFGLSIKSKHVHNIGDGHQGKGLLIVLAVIIGSVIVVNRLNYWKRFIEIQRKERPGWYGSINFKILNPWFRDAVRIGVATFFTVGSLMLSSKGEEKDLFGGFATVSLALGIIIYERTLSDHLGLSEGIITLQGSLWAGPYKHTSWVVECVAGSIFGLYATREWVQARRIRRLKRQYRDLDIEAH